MKRKQGVSLIVLVITIIIMIILASTVIITINNNSIIESANIAVDLTNLRQLHDMASAAWTAAYIDGARTQGELETAVVEALKNADTSKFKIVVTTEGVKVIAKGDMSLTLDKTTITETISKGLSETATIVATTKNIDKELIWSSDNEAVATVSANGNEAIITLLDEGVATITVSAEGLTATCTVNVKAEALEGQELNFAHDAFYGVYSSKVIGLKALENGKTYIVIWDGVEYTCVASDRKYQAVNTSLFTKTTLNNAVGNSQIGIKVFGLDVTTTESNTGEPFLISNSEGTTYIISADTEATHTVRIYEKVD